MLGLGIVVLAAGLFSFTQTSRANIATNTWSLDFDINVVAAQRLVDHQPIYDRDASRAEGRRNIGNYMRFTSRDAFSSYIGSPVVALTHVPFLGLNHAAAVRLYRILALVEMVLALVLVAWSLSPPARLPAALMGVGALFWGFPMVKSLALGQGNGLVMLGLALGVWAAVRERWGLAGIGLGLATVLKISPVLLVVYLLLRGKRRAVWTAAATALAALALAATVGRVGDVVVWLRDVTPQVSRGTVSAYNQSIVGALARMTSGGADFSSHAGPGSWYLLAYVLWAGAVVGLWRWRRHRPFDSLELGVLILVALLAGPLTWDHYFTWALIPLVLMLDNQRWIALRPIEIGLLVVGIAATFVLYHHGIALPPASLVRADWGLRVGSARYVGAALVAIGIATWLLARAPDRHDRRSEWPDERGGTPVGAARRVVATGVHGRG
jgi:alpha-1,2-mannosyltransferase